MFLIRVLNILFLLYVKKVAGATEGKKIFAKGERELILPWDSNPETFI